MIGDEIAGRLLPMLLEHLPLAHAPIKAELVGLLVQILKLEGFTVRQEVQHTLLNVFGKSRSCYDRMIFLQFCAEVARRFSTSYFKKHILPALLMISSEEPNVILVLVE
jgi:hypothetical protein